MSKKIALLPASSVWAKVIVAPGVTGTLPNEKVTLLSAALSAAVASAVPEDRAVVGRQPRGEPDRAHSLDPRPVRQRDGVERLARIVADVETARDVVALPPTNGHWAINAASARGRNAGRARSAAASQVANRGKVGRRVMASSPAAGGTRRGRNVSGPLERAGAAPIRRRRPDATMRRPAAAPQRENSSGAPAIEPSVGGRAPPVAATGQAISATMTDPAVVRSTCPIATVPE